MNRKGERGSGLEWRVVDVHKGRTTDEVEGDGRGETEAIEVEGRLRKE